MWSWKTKKGVDVKVAENLKIELTVKKIDNHEFDIEGIKVVSIERYWRNHGFVTNIGYILESEKEILEWYMYTTQEEHDRFIRRFRKKLNLKENSDSDSTEEHF